MAALGEDSLASIEKRISELESQVYANENEKNIVQETTCIEEVDYVHQKLADIANKYTRLGDAWKKLKELEIFLTPEFLEKVTLSDDAKADIIIAGENHIKTCAEKLQELNNLKDVVSPDKLKNLQTWASKLEPLTQIHIQQQEEYNDVNAQFIHLLTSYNNIVNLISKQFEEWDEYVTKLEQAVEERSGRRE